MFVSRVMQNFKTPVTVKFVYIKPKVCYYYGMEEEIIQKNKDEFLQIARENIHRDGLEDLLTWLCSTDFFEAPASTKFHSAEAGGLCFHSMNVFKRLLKLATDEFGDNVNKESVAVVGLFHDVCKCCYYKTEYRNAKDENGNWVKKPYYAVDDLLPYGHGEKSVYMINGYMRLTREEALAINWHMGGFDKRVIGGDFGMAKSFYKYPLCTLTHIADVMATYLDETGAE